MQCEPVPNRYAAADGTIKMPLLMPMCQSISPSLAQLLCRCAHWSRRESRRRRVSTAAARRRHSVCCTATDDDDTGRPWNGHAGRLYDRFTELSLVTCKNYPRGTVRFEIYPISLGWYTDIFVSHPTPHTEHNAHNRHHACSPPPATKNVIQFDPNTTMCSRVVCLFPFSICENLCFRFFCKLLLS